MLALASLSQHAHFAPSHSPARLPLVPAVLARATSAQREQPVLSPPSRSAIDSQTITRHKATGWSVEEQRAFLLEGRDWQAVNAFWKAAVAGRSSLADLQPPLTDPQAHMQDMVLCSPIDALSNADIAGTSEAEAAHTACQGGPHTQPDSIQITSTDQTASEHRPQSTLALSAEQQADVPRRRPGRKKQDRITYKVGLAYYGPAFNGWARQPNTVTHTDTNTDTHTTQQQSLPSVESALSQALYTLTGASKHVAVAGAGRTDKGVHALGQVFSFYSWGPPLTPHAIAHSVCAHSGAPPGTLRVVAVGQKPRVFHAQFAATWRRYVYLLPLCTQPRPQCGATHTDVPATQPTVGQPQVSAAPQPTAAQQQSAAAPAVAAQSQPADCNPQPTVANSPVAYAGQDVDPDTVHVLLQALVGKPLDYYAFARDTPKGKDTVCHLTVARASRVTLPATCSHDIQGKHAGTEALCIELVADRFLRKMVRVLVSTAVMEAVALQQTRGCPYERSQAPTENGGEQTFAVAAAMQQAQDSQDTGHAALLRHCLPGASRQDTCVPAPAEGLCLAGVGYDDQDAADSRSL